MPVPEDDRSPVEILNGWATVSISEEGTFKYVLIEAYATETIPGKNTFALLQVSHPIRGGMSVNLIYI